jgi:hypothetical protein
MFCSCEMFCTYASNCCTVPVHFRLNMHTFRHLKTYFMLIFLSHYTRVRISIRARCTTLCDKVCQWLATGRWFSPAPLVSSTNKTDRHDITEILLKVALSTIKQTKQHYTCFNFADCIVLMLMYLCFFLYSVKSSRELMFLIVYITCRIEIKFYLRIHIYKCTIELGKIKQ